MLLRCLADLWAGAVAVFLGFHELAPVVGGDILSAGSEFADYVMKDCGVDARRLPSYAAARSVNRTTSPGLEAVLVGR